MPLTNACVVTVLIGGLDRSSGGVEEQGRAEGVVAELRKQGEGSASDSVRYYRGKGKLYRCNGSLIL